MSGYKTYIVAFLGVVYSVSGYFTGHLDINSAAQMIEVSLGLAALRNGIANTTQS